MKTNEELQKDVQDAIKWEPSLHAAEIGVIAIDGVITLSGIVNTYAKKLEAEHAAKNVLGVKAVVEKIRVKFNNVGDKNDNEIATEILKVFAQNSEIPNDRLKLKVERAWVTFEGDFEWNFQKEAVDKSITHISGIAGITNNLKIVSKTYDQIEKVDIESALSRNWALGGNQIEVIVKENKVMLTGKVQSLYQKDAASRIAWNAPGVAGVDNELEIE